jgi:hypothetical protein
MSWQFDVDVLGKGGDNMCMCLLWKGTRLQYFIPNNFQKTPKEDEALGKKEDGMEFNNSQNEWLKSIIHHMWDNLVRFCYFLRVFLL